MVPWKGAEPQVSMGAWRSLQQFIQQIRQFKPEKWELLCTGGGSRVNGAGHWAAHCRVVAVADPAGGGDTALPRPEQGSPGCSAGHAME